MPTFSHNYLHKVCLNLFKAAGTSEEEAHIVAKHLVKANLVGHDSHGLVRVPGYMEGIKRGHIVPDATLEVVRETPTTACINGHWGFGFVVTENAMRIAIQKAKAHNVAALTVFYQSHIGRLGDFPIMAAQEGMIALITADSGGGGKRVVPFGGIEGRLGTNPFSIAIPSNLNGPVFLDMATSIVAGGKLQIAMARNKQVPIGWILDKDGNPTTDPASARTQGGFILPLGGDKGYKGYGLSFMVEVMSGILTGLGFGLSRKDWEVRHGCEHRHNDGCFIFVLNVDAFYPLEEFKREVTEFAKFVKSSPPAKGLKENLEEYMGFELDPTQVLYPGEPEWLIEQRRRKEGIFIEDKTWDRISNLLSEYKIESIIGKP